MEKSLSHEYLNNVWYQAGWSHELDQGPLCRTILGIPLFLYRTDAQQIAALHDRCPHRVAPLSAGRLNGGIVTCGYHGLAFDAAGNCVRNPHGPVTLAMRVGSFTAVERHQALWIWFGSGEARPERIPDLSFIDATPQSARITSHMSVAAHYQLLTDNIMDLSHADYLHPATLGGMMTGAKTSVTAQGEQIKVVWNSLNCDAPPAFHAMVPPPGKADIWTQVVWSAPAVMVLATAAMPAGVPRSDADEAYTLHNMSPETDTTSHYFMCSTRRFLMDNQEFSTMLRAALTQAFEQEDKPMLEKQQQRMDTADFWSLEPVLLGIDTAAVLVRRALDRLIANETESRP
jgi:phenylpropionate dioxygenase-like ring-hydroxylating dioxygenase large terminal subunit